MNDLQKEGYSVSEHKLTHKSVNLDKWISITETFVFCARDPYRTTQFIKGLKEYDQFVYFEDLPEDMIEDAKAKLIKLGGHPESFTK